MSKVQLLALEMSRSDLGVGRSGGRVASPPWFALEIFFLCLFRVGTVAYGGSQARG